MSPATIQPTDSTALAAVLAAARQPIDILCDRWTLALVEALLAAPGRFSALQSRSGLANRLLVARLQSLHEVGIVMAESAPGRTHRRYRLTEKGLALRSIIAQMARWERRWRAPGEDAEPLRCRTCAAAATARDIDLRLSLPQLRRMPAKQTLRRRSSLAAIPNSTNGLGLILDIFGDKWSIEIVLCAFFRIRRFNAIRRTIGIAANILTDRLHRLVEAGLLEPTEDGGYHLTERGVDLYGVIVSIQSWADTWLEARYKSPVILIHRSCGEAFVPAEPAGEIEISRSVAKPVLARRPA